MVFRRLVTVVILGTAAALAGWSQSTATLSGRVTDPLGGGVEEARVMLDNPVTGFHKEVSTLANGEFTLANVPFQDYTLTAEKGGFATSRRTVGLRTNIPVRVAVEMRLADVVERVSVTAYETADLVDPEATGTRTVMSQESIDRMPKQVGSRGIEAVIMTFPGFSANANGAIHPRGAHNQMTFVVDGMPISDQLTGSFGTAIDSNIVQTIELFTGNVPPEFGSKVSGVASITTRSGLGTGRKFSGSTTLGGSEFDTLSQVTQVAGEAGRLGYFASFNSVKSNRFLDQVTLDNLHNGGNAERALARVDYQLSERDSLRFNVMAGRSSFQLANLPSQHDAGQQQRQLMRDFSGWIGYLRTLSPRSTFDSTVSFRNNNAQFFPSAGDTPVTASQARHMTTINIANRYNMLWGAHTLRLGADLQHFPVSENFSFGITDPNFNHPSSEDYIPTLAGVDLSRGGSLFQFSDKRSGNQYTGFLQDNIRWRRFQFSLGLRYDSYRFLVNGAQWQPRVGMAYHLQETGTVLRASYNRNYQTPPNENLLLANTDKAGVLVLPNVRETVGGAFLRIRPERQNVYEVGVQQALMKRLSLNAMYFHKNATDMQDNDNFFNTGIIFPTSLAQSRINGVETRITVPQTRGFSGSLSASHSRIIVTPPFTGGLFLGNTAVELLSEGPFIIDHDQVLALHGLVNYTSKKGFWTSWSIRHDSGLVSNPSDPVEVAADPDFAALLPYVDLVSDPPRVRPRTILDFSAGYERSVEGVKKWELMFQLSNITNRTALYNFQSIFVGTRLVQPRTAGVKLRFYF